MWKALFSVQSLTAYPRLNSKLYLIVDSSFKLYIYVIKFTFEANLQKATFTPLSSKFEKNQLLRP